MQCAICENDITEPICPHCTFDNSKHCTSCDDIINTGTLCGPCDRRNALKQMQEEATKLKDKLRKEDDNKKQIAYNRISLHCRQCFVRIDPYTPQTKCHKCKSSLEYKCVCGTLNLLVKCDGVGSTECYKCGTARPKIFNDFRCFDMVAETEFLTVFDLATLVLVSPGFKNLKQKLVSKKMKWAKKKWNIFNHRVHNEDNFITEIPIKGNPQLSFSLEVYDSSEETPYYKHMNLRIRVGDNSEIINHKWVDNPRYIACNAVFDLIKKTYPFVDLSNYAFL